MLHCIEVDACVPIVTSGISLAPVAFPLRLVIALSGFIDSVNATGLGAEASEPPAELIRLPLVKAPVCQ